MIGKRLRRLRLAKGLTQRELAAPNFTDAYVSTIEAGRRHPSRRALEHFADKLGVSVDELATGRPPDLEERLELRLHEARVALSAGRRDEAAAGLGGVIRGAKRYGLRRVEAGAEVAKGLMEERKGDPESALRHYQRSEDLLSDEPAIHRVEAVDGKARAFTSLGDVRYAIHLLESALGEIEREQLDDPNALARIHAGLVYSYVDAGLYEKAAESATVLNQLAPRLTDPFRVAQMHLHVAQLLLVQGRPREALRSLQRCEDAYRQVDLKVEVGYAQLARGYVLSREGKLQQARRELVRALAVFEDAADEKDLIRALNELARVERLEGRKEEAINLLNRSIELIGESDDPILAWAHRELGLAVFDDDQITAEKHLRISIDLYERAGQSVELARTYGVLGELFTMHGDAHAGCTAYRDGIHSLGSVG